MNPKSETLFHFTKNMEILENLLTHGFWPRFCLEDVHWLGYEEFDYISYPMVCFCDIPLSRISEHVGFYGNFGLGMTKSWAEKNGLNPVFYVSRTSQVAKSFNRLNHHANQIQNKIELEKAKINNRYLYAFTKPTEGEMVLDGQPVKKIFYQESEWRFVPQNANPTYLLKAHHNKPDELDEANTFTFDNCLLKFTPQDIRYIFVNSDTDIPRIMNFIQNSMDRYPAADLKILMSRVVSLESLSQDL